MTYMAALPVALHHGSGMLLNGGGPTTANDDRAPGARGAPQTERNE